MGEVYRARDTRLNRGVAIKILPEIFALDADRLARFKREAQVLAALNHPHIAAIYGLEVRDLDSDIWIWDLGRETLTRLTSDPRVDLSPLWTGDGRRIIFSSFRAGPNNLFSQAADGTGTAERLTDAANGQLPEALSPDGSRLIVGENGATSSYDLLILPLGERRAIPLVQTRFNESGAEVSADGRWLAYQSDESGQHEVYVRPFPNVDGGRWQVSTGGGAHPLWAKNGRDLFYEGPDGGLMGVTVQTNPIFTAGGPKPIVSPRNYFFSPQNRSYDVSTDGRFLMIERAMAPGGAEGTGMVVVLNWAEELKRLFPAQP